MFPARRKFFESMVGLGAMAGLPPRFARGQTRSWRIGVLSPRGRSLVFDVVAERLGELGYVEGKNLVVDFRSAEGVIEHFPALAAELVRAKCDLLVAAGDVHSARALTSARGKVPLIIMALDYDPVKAGMVASLRRPGGNVTGLFVAQPATSAKRLELLRELIPAAKRCLVLVDPFSTDQLEAVEQTAHRLGVIIISESFAAPPYDYATAFNKGRAAGMDAMLALASPVFLDGRESISEQLVRYRIPAASFVLFDDDAYLMSYGFDLPKTLARAGDIAAAVLKGAKAGDLPMEQPTLFDLAINLRRAKALGIGVPTAVILRANRVIN